MNDKKKKKIGKIFGYSCVLFSNEREKKLNETKPNKNDWKRVVSCKDSWKKKYSCLLTDLCTSQRCFF